MYFSKNIKYLRENKGLTQIALAHAIGKKKGIIGAYENERTNPDIPSFISLCQYFDTDPTTLLYTDMAALGGGSGAGVALDQIPNTGGELEQCKARLAALEKELALKDEIIALLKDRIHHLKENKT